MVAKKILTEEEIEEIEDREDIEAADRAMDEIEAGEKPISLEEYLRQEGRFDLLNRRKNAA